MNATIDIARRSALDVKELLILAMSGIRDVRFYASNSFSLKCVFTVRFSSENM